MTPPQQPTDITTERHRQVIEKFKQKDLALEINELLLEIEKGAYHGLLFIKPVKTDEGIQYSAISEVTPVKLFVCKICGYSESYLVDPELEQPGGID